MRRPVASGYTLNNHVELVRGGRDYFSLLLQLINKAKHSIHFHVYIFDEDETGNAVAEALMAAARRGVDVYLLIDGYASQELSEDFIRSILQSGIRFRMFEPLYQTSNFYFGRRMHHKVVVVDSIYSLVGGINISDKYNDLNGVPAWLDWAIYCYGDVSGELLKQLAKLYTRSRRKTKAVVQQHYRTANITEECRVRIRRNDWVRNKTLVTGSYFQMMRSAKEHITIMSSYFLPGQLFRMQLSRACKKGIRMRLILAGTSDVKLAKHAERFIYRWLLRNGVEIYEFQPSVLHGKLATMDDRWATIGSYNINNISAFASLELNLDVDDVEFATSLRKRLDEIIKNDCVQITEEIYRTNFSLLSRFVQWSSYQIVRLLFYLFTFYYRQEK